MVKCHDNFLAEKTQFSFKVSQLECERQENALS